MVLWAINMNASFFSRFEDWGPIIFIPLCGEIICIFKLYCIQKSLNKGALPWSAIFLNDDTYIDILFTFWDFIM